MGYPKCCIEWHKRNRVYVVEARFQDTEQYIMRNPLAFHDLQVETEEQMYSALLCRPMHLERQEAVFESINEHILETWSRYPFVPHWACSHCLNGKSTETERLNSQYKDVAIKLSPKFAQDIIHHLHKFTE